MAKIIVLDELTACQIAAGEVVERPVSVVKELVENSIDAGASRIIVDLEEGGLASLTVTDDGCGMEQDDLPLAFQRHATSKIRNAGDLSRLGTLGFRGEALPSIAAVSKLTITTRTHEGISGYRAETAGGAPVVISPAGCPPGTAVAVRELFYNTPARRKTMKSPSAEGALCGELISRLALARPDVSYELRVKGRRVFFSGGSGRLIDSVISVYGRQQGKEMVEVNASEGEVFLAGFAGKPSLSRSSRGHITVIINGRYVQSQVLARAVEEAYHTLLPQGRKPVAILSLSVRPDLLDVNIHPAKLEVRLLEEESVARVVTGALKDALRVKTVIPSPAPGLKKKTWPEPDQSRIEFNSRVGHQSRAEDGPPGATTKKPAEAVHTAVRQDCRPEQAELEGHIYSQTAEQQKRAVKAREEDSGYTGSGERFPLLKALAQLPPTYILAGAEDGLYIVDQHAAHERVLYEEFFNSRKGEAPVQYLLDPVTLELDYREATLLVEKILWFTDTGFILEHFGGNTFLLRGAPLSFPPGQAKELFLDLVDYFREKGASASKKEFLTRIASALACRNAVKAGEALSMSSMDALLKSLSLTENPYTCPHGRPTVMHLSYGELKSRFKR